jgi:hypothetical protein
MCKVGDIILIDSYKHGDTTLPRHSFIVISDKNGEIEGVSYDMMCNVLSSIKDPAQRARKLSYPGNYEIKNSDTVTNPNNGKDGFVKTDQLYLFRKDNISFRVIGSVSFEAMERLLSFINSSNIPIEIIKDNL